MNEDKKVWIAVVVIIIICLLFWIGNAVVLHDWRCLITECRIIK